MFEFTLNHKMVVHYDLDALAKEDASELLKCDFAVLNWKATDAVAEAQAALDYVKTSTKLIFKSLSNLSLYMRLLAFVALLRRFLGSIIGNIDIAENVIKAMMNVNYDVTPAVSPKMREAIRLIDILLQKDHITLGDYNLLRPKIWELQAEALPRPIMLFMLLLWNSESSMATPLLRVIFQRLLGIDPIRFEYIQKCMALVSKVLANPPCAVKKTFWASKLDKRAPMPFPNSRRQQHAGKLAVHELLQLVPFWDPQQLVGANQEAWMELITQMAVSFENGFEVDRRPSPGKDVFRFPRVETKKKGSWNFWKRRAEERC
ncbi:hypothetical protein HDU96_000861 [Phlyctochytrium bullatum]|nr:hypothetical protein HDU96_000861 [Phlyctochytrium bullatum]